jgi:hypothetical protein
MSMKITLDTNCLFDYFERNPVYIQALVAHASKGHVELAITTRVMSDTADRWKGSGTSPMWDKIQSFPALETIGTVFRLGSSHLEFKDRLASEDDVKMADRLREIMAGAQVQDIDHLLGHIMDKRDIFVTADAHFLDHQEELKNEFGLVVLAPKDAVDQIDKTYPSQSSDAGSTV